MKQLALFLAFSLCTAAFAQKGLSRKAAEEASAFLIAQWKTEKVAKLMGNERDKAIRQDTLQMKYHYTIFGEEPIDGRSLWISLHGGGNVPGKINDSQWENQKRLYKPAEGVYLSPRAPWNDWDMWCKPPIDSMFEELIQTMIVTQNVNPDKVYLMGYSAGGDGVWRLAPRLADHWASASMMAGHPGDVGLVNVRNLPYTIWVGELDAAYNRNVLVRQRGVQLDSLQKGDPEGYVHECHVMEGMPHWMKLKDAAAVPWMAQYRRNPYPTKVAWQQEAVLKHSFYWLQVPVDEMARGKRIIAQIADNVITISECDYSRLTILLNDEMVNLDKSVKVVMNGKTLFKGKVRRTMENLRKTLSERNDPSYVFPSAIDVAIKK